MSLKEKMHINTAVEKQPFGKQDVLHILILPAAFLLIASPYMKLKGAIFPKKDIGQFAADVQSCTVYQSQVQPDTDTHCVADIAWSDIAGAFVELFFIPNAVA